MKNTSLEELITKFDETQDAEILEQIADRYVEMSQYSDGSGANEEAVEHVEELIDSTRDPELIYSAVNKRYLR